MEIIEEIDYQLKIIKKLLDKLIKNYITLSKKLYNIKLKGLL